MFNWEIFKVEITGFNILRDSNHSDSRKSLRVHQQSERCEDNSLYSPGEISRSVGHFERADRFLQKCIGIVRGKDVKN